MSNPTRKVLRWCRDNNVCWYCGNNRPRKRGAKCHRRRKRVERQFIPLEVRVELLEKQDCKCVYCGKAIALNAGHVDHRVPLYLGGSNHPDNLQYLCAKCNMEKSWIHPKAYVRYLNSKRRSSNA